jgi:hypothetical protein
MEQTEKTENLDKTIQENEYDSLNFISVRNVSQPEEEGDGEISIVQNDPEIENELINDDFTQ